MARPGTAWGTIRLCPYTLRATSDTGDNRKEDEEDDDEWDVSVPVSVVAVMLVVAVVVELLLLMFITGQWDRNCSRKAFS